MTKLIIWDLDDTLWRGTLAEGDTILPFENRVSLICALNARGIVSSICSKNDFETAKTKLCELGIWDQFVFPHIAFSPKGSAIAQIIDNMQLRAADVLFVDDNPVNLQEVKFRLPAIQVLDANRPDVDSILADILEKAPKGKSRLPQYRILEQKVRDRCEAKGTNEDFLRSCGVKATAAFTMDNLDFLPRIVELINRSNQLNYTGSRVEQSELESSIIDVVRYDSWSIFAWDRYGDYGLIGFVMVERVKKKVIHFVFSCRVMHMGIEGYALRKVCEHYTLCNSEEWLTQFDHAEPDWIEDCSYHDPSVRDRLRSGQVNTLRPRLRIMFDCQSGGIAHFSRYRECVEFDNNPRLFSLPMVWDDRHLEQEFPKFVVYGAGIDYADPRWGNLAQELPFGVYECCVAKICSFFLKKGTRAMIVLPPENLPDSFYRPQYNQTRDRVVAFNRYWWRAAAQFDCIDIVDLSQADSADMADAVHYRPNLLVELAETIDDWLDAVGALVTEKAA